MHPIPTRSTRCGPGTERTDRTAWPSGARSAVRRCLLDQEQRPDAPVPQAYAHLIHDDSLGVKNHRSSPCPRWPHSGLHPLQWTSFTNPAVKGLARWLVQFFPGETRRWHSAHPHRPQSCLVGPSLFRCSFFCYVSETQTACQTLC